MTPKLVVMGLCGMLVVAPRLARAKSVNFLETVGISTGVGTVLGASTLPFYDEPFEHTSNLAIGAASGLVVGVGIWVYEKFIASDDDGGRRSDFNYHPQIPVNVNVNRSLARGPQRTTVLVPLVSLNW